jgi:hypothetical protein
MNIENADENWFCHFNPKTNNEAWNDNKSHLQRRPSTSKVMGTILSDTKKCTLIDFLLTGETIILVGSFICYRNLNVTLQPGLHEETHHLSTRVTSLHT